MPSSQSDEALNKRGRGSSEPVPVRPGMHIIRFEMEVHCPRVCVNVCVGWPAWYRDRVRAHEQDVCVQRFDPRTRFHAHAHVCTYARTHPHPHTAKGGAIPSVVVRNSYGPVDLPGSGDLEHDHDTKLRRAHKKSRTNTRTCTPTHTQARTHVRTHTHTHTHIVKGGAIPSVVVRDSYGPVDLPGGGDLEHGNNGNKSTATGEESSPHHHHHLHRDSSGSTGSSGGGLGGFLKRVLQRPTSQDPSQQEHEHYQQPRKMAPRHSINVPGYRPHPSLSDSGDKMENPYLVILVPVLPPLPPPPPLTHLFPFHCEIAFRNDFARVKFRLL